MVHAVYVGRALSGLSWKTTQTVQPCRSYTWGGDLCLYGNVFVSGVGGGKGLDPDRARTLDRRTRGGGDSQPAGLSAGGRAGLSEPGAVVGDAFRRRGAADSARDADRFEAARGALCPG